MKKIIFLCGCFIMFYSMGAQIKGDYTWPLGYGGTYDISGDYNGMLLGFNQTPPSLVH